MDDAVRDTVARALEEDLGSGDITSRATVSEDARAEATIVRKQAGVVFGLSVVAEVFSQTGVEEFEELESEGQWSDSVPMEVARVGGSARGLLAGERTALNLLCHLSGIATLTARFVEAVKGADAVILDTRKTTPGLRGLEKAAVVAGGGTNHRMGLDDAVLIKENHIALAGGLAEAVRRVRAAEPDREVEVECRTVDEAAYALGTGAHRLLLDNMGPDELRRAAEARDAAARAGNRRAHLEASGGVTFDNVAEIAASGVDFISVGALTHSAPALDLSMLLKPG
jgi:nicotinate-nucleotide pyrophosphorylase (carboxylating)